METTTRFVTVINNQAVILCKKKVNHPILLEQIPFELVIKLQILILFKFTIFKKQNKAQCYLI